GPVGGVLVVGHAAAGPGPGLDEHPVPGPGQLLDPGRHHRHAVLVRLDLLRYADDHLEGLAVGCGRMRAGIVRVRPRANQGEVPVGVRPEMPPPGFPRAVWFAAASVSPARAGASVSAAARPGAFAV